MKRVSLRSLFQLFLAGVTVLLLWSCKGNQRTGVPNSGKQSGSYTRYAGGFGVEQAGDLKLVHVFDPWQNSRNATFPYLLGKDPARVPDSLRHLPFIEVPVRRVITLSTTHIAMIRSLDESGTIRGTSGADLVYDTAMIERIRKGEVIDVGYDRSLNYELIVSLQPDVLFLYGVESSIREISGKLIEMGVPVVFCGDYLEEHPLGKAQLVRLFSLFFHRESEADSLFGRIDSSYRALTAMTGSLEEKPSVLTGLPWKDAWYMAGGNSYAAKLIEDAGGRYLWEDSESAEAIPLNIESVFSRAVGADVWINPGAAASLEDLYRFDERFSTLDVVKEGMVYNNNARLNPLGGNDYWESGAVRPDLVLADLIKIFHPDLMKDHRCRYYRQLK